MNEVPHPVHGLQMVMCTCPGPATPTSWSGRMLKAREQRLLDLALWLGLPEDHRGEERKSPQSIQAKDREAKGEMESRWIPAPNSHKATTGASTVPTPPRPRKGRRSEGARAPGIFYQDRERSPGLQG